MGASKNVGKASEQARERVSAWRGVLGTYLSFRTSNDIHWFGESGRLLFLFLLYTHPRKKPVLGFYLLGYNTLLTISFAVSTRLLLYTFWLFLSLLGDEGITKFELFIARKEGTVVAAPSQYEAG